LHHAIGVDDQAAASRGQEHRTKSGGVVSRDLTFIEQVLDFVGGELSVSLSDLPQAFRRGFLPLLVGVSFRLVNRRLEVPIEERGLCVAH
jgi:hypothetical protein